MTTLLSTNTCLTCLKQLETTQRCSRCRVAQYCDTECQKKDWPRHKQFCSNSPATKQERLTNNDLLAPIKSSQILFFIICIKEYILTNNIQPHHNLFQLSRLSQTAINNFRTRYPLLIHPSHTLYVLSSAYESSLPPLAPSKLSLLILTQENRNQPLVSSLNHQTPAPPTIQSTTMQLFGDQNILVEFLHSQPGKRMQLYLIPETNAHYRVRMSTNNITIF